MPRDDRTIESARNEWTKKKLEPSLKRGPERRERFTTTSGIEIKRTYEPDDVKDLDFLDDIGFPGEYPFTRGVQPTMYRGRLWTMRQYAGFGDAEESNRRYRYLFANGQTGLSVAASILLALYLVVAEKRNVPWAKLNGTIQNDILKEYVARGTYIYPPRGSMRIITDIFEYATKEVPNWNTISISGYHIREAGSTAAQELAFTIANGIAYVEAAIKAGLKVDDFASRLSFFFNVHNNFFEEVAKYRAARRLWARIMKDRFGAKDERSMMVRFHAQTAGSSLTAQQVDNNVVRVTLQALAAVLGGAQSLHTNSRDEALALPSETSALLALRTQQVIAHESGVTDTIDPLGGSWYVESLTSELEKKTREYLEKIDDLGGAVAAIERGYMQREIQNAAFIYQREIETRDRIIVGVNEFIARDGANLMPPIIDAVRAYATLGEISDAMRRVFGEYHPSNEV